MVANRWWKGPRGEWYVVAQFAIFIMIVAGSPGFPLLPQHYTPSAAVVVVLGLLLLCFGALLAAAGFLSLGTNLTIFPKPRERGELVATGAYRIVRHPIYSGIFCAAIGWGLLNRSWLLIAYALVLFWVQDMKARREEKWLLDRFPAYVAYRKKVKRLIPFIY
jgi:protein-S-isoprenylcysteine O-methyltransferase Ste14